MSGQSDTGFVKTRSSTLRPHQPEQFEEVVFTSHKAERKERQIVKGSKKNKLPDPVPKRDENEQTSFMKKARYDIIKFGMSGFDAAKKEETKQALAISLGAKPKKAKGINYKELKEKRKSEQEERKLELAFQNIGKTSSGHASAKVKKRKRSVKVNSKDHKGNILSVYGKVKKHELDKS